MRTRWFFALGLLALGCNDSPDAASPSHSPSPRAADSVKHVLLITVDTLRADVLGVAGGRARTPVLDALAAEGWWFEHSYSASMLTNPSHASIMTSLYPRDHGVYDNESGIAAGVPTLADAMRKDGRRTGAVLNFPHLNPSVSNLGQGFERVIEATKRERRAPEIADRTLELIDALSSDDPAAPGWFVWTQDRKSVV